MDPSETAPPCFYGKEETAEKLGNSIDDSNFINHDEYELQEPAEYFKGIGSK